MIVLNNELKLESIESVIPEATSRLSFLSESFSKDDINKIIINLVESEPEVAIAMGSLNEDMPLNEFMVKHVSSKGDITRTKDRKTRERQALQTTGLSKAARRKIAKKAAKTKRANPSSQVRASKKFKKAMKRRKSLGLS